MRFETIKYIEWMKTRPKKKYDLCSSSARDFSLKNLSLDFNELEIIGKNVHGYYPLLQAVAEKYGVKEENVVSAIGTSHAIFLVCAALIEPGDEVLIEKPAYEPLLAVPRSLGAKVRRFERKFEDNYLFDLGEFESAVSDDTKVVLLTNLHNPSGALLSRSFLEEMSEILTKKEVKVVIDEIYLEFLEGDAGKTSFHLEENFLVISSLTKVYGLGGLRSGWILAPSELATRMRRIIDYTNVEGVFIGEQISTKTFSQLDDIRKRNNERIEKNRLMIKNFIQEEERLSWVEPAGGVICFPRVESNLTGDELAELLQERYDTNIVPGSFFENPQHFRIGFDVRPEILAKALENIQNALQNFCE